MCTQNLGLNEIGFVNYMTLTQSHVEVLCSVCAICFIILYLYMNTIDCYLQVLMQTVFVYAHWQISIYVLSDCWQVLSFFLYVVEQFLQFQFF
jgi:hypothetical protein